MKEIYTLSGTLNQNFVGQISYTICLDQEYQEMNIQFTFNKQRYTTEHPEILQTIKQEAQKNHTPQDTQEILDSINELKTEIHTIATMNDTFIGGIHRQATTRDMYFSSTTATEGCIPQKSIQGVIKVTLVVFNVILSDTNYTLTLSVNDTNNNTNNTNNINTNTHHNKEDSHV